MKYTPTHSFARYAPIIDNWEAFALALEQPLVRSLWLNPLKPLSFAVKQNLSANWEPLFIANAYSSTQTDLGTQWAYHAGLYHIQELVSMLPVLLLDPKPGERILDLCAAPGSKTMQIALAMQNQGTLIANDKNYSRSKALRFHLERLGILNVTTTTFDGASFPNAAGLFDKILVDAPCSGEGTSRKHSKNWKVQQNAHNIHKLQQRILKRAVALCKPGGLILYSTCTYAPEENENVVNTALQQHPELTLLPISLPGLQITPGITQWQDQRYAPELVHTARLWPHHNNTGGFYLALLQKKIDAPSTEFSVVNYGEPLALTQLQDYLAPFAFPMDLFKQYACFTVPKHGIYLVSKDHQGVTLPNPDAVGLFILKTRMDHPKLTTAGARLFGHWAQDQFIELDDAQMDLYFHREDFAISAAQTESCSKMGYVIVRHQGLGLGVGLLLNSIVPGEWRLRSLYPKR